MSVTSFVTTYVHKLNNISASGVRLLTIFCKYFPHVSVYGKSQLSHADLLKDICFESPQIKDRLKLL